MRGLARPRTLTGFSIALTVSLLLLSVVAAYRWGILVMLLPLPILALPLLGRRVFSNPVLVLSLFLAVVVNLDFFRFGNILSADILASSFFLYALIVRIGIQRRPLLENQVEKVYLYYLLAVLPSVILSLNLAASFKNWSRDLEYFILLHFVAGLRLTQEHRKTLTGAILLASVVPCLLALVGMWQGIPDFYGMDTPVGGGERVARVTSTLGHASMFALFLCTTGILNLAMILEKRWFRRRWLVPLFVLQVVLLYFTYSRSQWIQFVVSFCILLWMLGYRRVMLAGIPAGLVTLALAVPTFLARWETVFSVDRNNSMIWRLGLWVKALALYPRHPVFGTGPDTFADYVNFLGLGAHNTWLKLLIETGAIGLVTYVILMVAVVKAFRKRLRSDPSRQDPLLVPTYAILIGYLVASMVSDAFEVPPVTIYLWALIAMVLGWKGEGEEATPVPSPGGRKHGA